MKGIAGQVNQMDTEAIRNFEANGTCTLVVNDTEVVLDSEDIVVSTADIPGMLVASENGVTVALDITMDDELKAEGLAREVVNRIQNLRKDSGLDVTDRILLELNGSEELKDAIEKNASYLCAEVLADRWEWVKNDAAKEVEIDEFTLEVSIQKA